LKLTSIHRTLILITLCVTSLNASYAQCFEIESLLVDACGAPEGENEMLRFKVGSSPLNSNNISVSWASANAWLGICQNTASANATSNLNNTITSCGQLIEPTGGILPANSTVLLITSTSVDANANSFANLNDTIYVIYQCTGNTGGHFGNFGTGLRTVSISFSTPIGCSDQVTYDKSLLLNQNLQSGGTSAIKNGGIVNFDPSGNDTYDNNGCQAPFNPTEISALNLSPLTICPGDIINLSSNITGAIQSVFWTGNNGSFSNINNATTTFISSFNDTTPYYIIIGGINACNDTILDSLLVNLNPASNVSILEPDTITICQGESFTLHASGSSPFLWNTGETTDSIIVNSAGNYYVSASGNCPSNIDTVTINFQPQLLVLISEPDTIELCDGNSVTLNATGSSSYIWNTGETGNSITVNTAGIYTVTSGENCPSNLDSTEVFTIQEPTLAILNPNNIELCQGETITLNTIASTSIVWNTGEITNSIDINTAGTFFATSTNSCFSISDTITIINSAQINVSILEPNSTICSNETITIHATGANSYIWNTGATSDSITVNSSGNYSVTSNGNCPSNSADIQITVTPQVTINILEGNSIVLCPNTTANLNASFSNNYQWNTGETNSSININSIGTYYVETTNGNCPSGYDTINVITDTPPEAIIIGDSTICDDYALTLYAEGTGNFNWSNGDEGNSTQTEIEGIITLTATNSCNQSISDSREIIKIDCSSTVYIPNSFTPNGDNINDYFKVEGTNIQSINGKIFNRWGELLYEWNNVKSSWNGTYQGEQIPVSSLVYKIKIELLNGEFETFIGKLSLLK
jgi:gliding motility-associated-like protein